MALEFYSSVVKGLKPKLWNSSYVWKSYRGKTVFYKVGVRGLYIKIASNKKVQIYLLLYQIYLFDLRVLYVFDFFMANSKHFNQFIDD